MTNEDLKAAIERIREGCQAMAVSLQTMAAQLVGLTQRVKNLEDRERPPKADADAEGRQN